ncbi:pyridoxamine 5'-phosphate oxidase family protein [Elioraea sp.]|uniref:pyridoxamine 5'-phosphate oxidase family protein n=1 Tax=Elioraea sp. TaxID=2185103 RepID=UPI0025BEF8A4|nr:pyridoxamine 5'-phosphate oxidase family protein [Elioraea sp.]
MADDHDMETRLWAALRADKIVMLGLVGAEGGHTRPMTAQFDRDAPPIWFFTSTDAVLVQKLGSGARATAAFVSSGHDLFATIEGTLVRDDDPAVIDRLWNSQIAVWYEHGRADPTLVLLRFDTTEAEIWLNETSLVAGLKLMFGKNPKQDAKEKVARVSLSRPP